MKRIDRIKLDFTRNWKLPGKERLSRYFKPNEILKNSINNGIAWLGNEDIAIYAAADNYIEWGVLSSGSYEDEINKLIRISLKPGNNSLDIGANIGLQSIRMSQCVGINGKVYAFEPIVYLQEKFKRNMFLNCVSNVKLFPCALSDKEDEADFKISRNIWNQGTFSLGSDGDGSEVQRVHIKIADNIPEIQTLKSVELVKIDVEGFEYPVLCGLKQTLIKHRPRIIFEYDRNYWDRTNQKIDDCYSFLQSLNYTFYQVTSVGCELIKNVESILSGNLFCIPDPTHE